MQNSNTSDHSPINSTRTFQTAAHAGFERGHNAEDSYPHRDGREAGDREIVSTRLLILREELQYEDIA